MAITKRQRELRRKSMGGSDAPAILGVSPWANPADIFWSKVADDEGGVSSPAMQAGNILERSVLDWFTSETGKKIRRNQRRVHSDMPMHANLDGIVVGVDGEIVQAKTTGIVSPGAPDLWGSGDDEVPDDVLVQVQHEMFVADAQIAFIPVLVGRVGFRLYRVPRDQEIIDSVVAEENAFWTNHVIPRVAPIDCAANIETLKRIKRVPDKVVEFDLAESEEVFGWELSRRDRLEYEKYEKERMSVIVGRLGDGEAARLWDGRMLTYFEQSRESFDSKRLRAEMPDVYEKYATRNKYRVLRLKGKPNDNGHDGTGDSGRADNTTSDGDGD